MGGVFRAGIGWMGGRAATLVVALGLVALGLVAALPLSPALAQETPTIRIMHLDRPPFYASSQGQPSGSINLVVARLLERAGIPTTWESAPTTRILRQIQSGDGLVCSPGWFRTAEREGYAWFSGPVYGRGTLVALTRSSTAPRIAALGTMQAVATEGSLTLGAIDGFFMGDFAEQQMARMGTRVVRFSSNLPQLVRMVAAGRFDFLLADLEEADFHIRTSGLDLDIVPLPDIPPGAERHLMCSKSMPPALARRIEAVRRDVTGLP